MKIPVLPPDQKSIILGDELPKANSLAGRLIRAMIQAGDEYFDAVEAEPEIEKEHLTGSLIGFQPVIDEMLRFARSRRQLPR
jgi:hypothetical protein